MAHYDRPVKRDIPLVVAYPVSGSAVLHKAGCSHAKGNRNVREAQPTSYDAAGVYADDWYEVAPCAADGKGRVCTSACCP